MSRLTRSATTAFVAGLLAVAVQAIPAIAVAQGAVVLVRIAEHGIVMRVDPVTGRERIAYRLRTPGWLLHEAAVSPTGRYIALIESTSGHERAGGYDVLPRNRLTVLDSSGRVTETLEHDVRRIEWCCGGDVLALITGPYSEEGGGFVPDSVLLHDVAVRSETVLRMPVRPTRIHWAAFDSSLYVTWSDGEGDSLAVWRYHVPTRRVSRTPYRGTDLSPAGAYYLARGTGDHLSPGWHLFERRTGREVPLPSDAGGNVKGWAFEEGDLLLLVHSRFEPLTPPRPGDRVVAGRTVNTGYSLWDGRTRTVRQRGPGNIANEGASASAGAIPIYRNGHLGVVTAPPR